MPRPTPTLTDDDRFEFTLAAGQAYRIGAWLDIGSAELDTRAVPGMHVPLVLTPRR